MGFRYAKVETDIDLTGAEFTAHAVYSEMPVTIIIGKLIIVFRIHGIGKPVIVITGIGYTGQHLSAVRISHDQGAGTWLQAQLSRCDLQGLDLAAHKIISADASGIQSAVLASSKSSTPGIENTYLVTDNGLECLTPFPEEIAELL